MHSTVFDRFWPKTQFNGYYGIVGGLSKVVGAFPPKSA